MNFNIARSHCKFEKRGLEPEQPCTMTFFAEPTLLRQLPMSSSASCGSTFLVEDFLANFPQASDKVLRNAFSLCRATHLAKPCTICHLVQHWPAVDHVREVSTTKLLPQPAPKLMMMVIAMTMAWMIIVLLMTTSMTMM